MRIHAEITEHVLPFSQPFIASRFTLTERRILLISVRDSESGLHALGESAPLEVFGTESYADARAALRSAAEILADTMISPDDIMHIAESLASPDDAPVHNGSIESDPGRGALVGLHDALRHTPTAQFAVESALLCLAAGLRGTSLAALLAADDSTRRDIPESVPVNCVIAGGDVREQALRFMAEGFTCFKMKVGGRPRDKDLSRVADLRSTIGADALIRLDANGAWSGSEAESMLADLAPHDIEYVEQPVAGDNVDGLVRLRRASPVRIAADESAQNLGTARALLQRDAADVYVLKPMAAGALRGCRRFALEAAACGREVVFTSLIDGSVGRSAVAHLAASLMHLCTRHHGLATGMMFAGGEPGDDVRGGRLYIRS